MSKTIHQLREEVRTARADHTRAQTDLSLAQRNVERATEAAANWKRGHVGNPTYIDPDRDDGLAADGRPPKVAQMDPKGQQAMIPALQERVAETAQAVADAETALEEAVEAGVTEEVDTSTGWVAARRFRWKGTEYQKGDAFDPTPLTAREVQKLEGARHIRPVRVPA